MGAASDIYYGAYCKTEAKTSDMSSRLGGNAVIVGNEVPMSTETIVTERGKEIPQVTVGIDEEQPIGCLPQGVGSKVALLQGKGWECHAYPSVIGYNQNDQKFWCEVAVVCYSTDHKKEFDAFCKKLTQRLGKGDHPDIDLSNKLVDRVISSGGTWCEMRTLPLPKLEKGNVYYKKHRSAADRAANAAVRNPRGCYIAIAVVVVVIIIAALIIYLTVFRH
ncbi:MAG: hypothetical protein LUD25_05665 [Coriobacteriaceae bacterium]|nr:hypothetical protein [Coriobacteriaceae bacterium]